MFSFSTPSSRARRPRLRQVILTRTLLRHSCGFTRSVLLPGVVGRLRRYLARKVSHPEGVKTLGAHTILSSLAPPVLARASGAAAYEAARHAGRISLFFKSGKVPTEGNREFNLG